MWRRIKLFLSVFDFSERTIILMIVLTCQLMLVLDGTVVYAALPHMMTELHFSAAALSWVQNSYLLTFGGFMLLGARTGDMWGYRSVFIVAVIAFTLASLAGGIAPLALWLLIARGVQGIAAAFAAPAALALLLHTYPQDKARLQALGFYTAISGIGSAIGLVLGGILTDLLSWRAVLFINLPIGVMLLTVAPFYLPRTRQVVGRFDVLGAVTATCGMGLLVFGLVHSASHGLTHPQVISSLGAGLLLIVLFVRIERHALQPILPLSLFNSAERTGAYAGKMLLIGGMLGTFFFLTQFVQHGLGYTAFKAGLTFVPLSIVQFMMVIFGVPRLLPRVGRRWLLVMGLVVAFVGMMCLIQVSPTTDFFPQLVLPIMLLGLGTGAALVPLAATGLIEVRECDAGAASGLVNVTHYVGGALGTAIIVACTHLINPTTIVSAHTAAQALSVSAIVSTIFFAMAIMIALVTMRQSTECLAKVSS